ncbi:hypothetical protein Z945_1878 [Sulfitobacter noctilucae]|nr:hypothetical protein Z945_1878 [Sulfitobacter noctilucae]
MGRLIKFLFLLLILGFIALVAFAYAGPFFGVQFAPAQVETRQPVTLGAD